MAILQSPRCRPRIGAGCLIAACLIASCSGFSSAPLAAADIIHVEVRYQEPAYTVSFEVLLEARHEHVRRLVTDYENLVDLSPTVVRSDVISSTPDGQSRVKLVLRPCFLIILCKRITKVTDSSVSEHGDVIHVTVPAESDFSQAREQLSITPHATDTERTRVSYRAYMVPKFRAPPIIGPWIIRRQIIEELTVTAQRVESLAQLM